MGYIALNCILSTIGVIKGDTRSLYFPSPHMSLHENSFKGVYRGLYVGVLCVY